MSASNRKPVHRAGLTLIEIMIALTMTLIVLGAMMTAFQYASEEMQNGRAIMEMANRARSVEDYLRADLDSLTLDPRPYTDSTNPNGYFELIEGGRRDNTSGNGIDSYLGDVDDILAMTIRSQDGNLYRGRSGGGIIQSSLAEVVWFTSLNDLNGDGVVEFDDSVRIHRRLLLVRPDLGLLLDEATPAAVNTFLANNDLSARVVPGTGAGLFDLIANNLGDLGRRESRFCHAIGAFPNALDRTLLAVRAHSNNEDILLTDVASFDLRVYSPNATVNVDANGIVVEPGDLGFDGTAPLTSLGAFVDLDHNGAGWFDAVSSIKSQCSYAENGFTTNLYDTWTPAYESDGIDQDGDGLVDEGTNGLDNGGTSAPDDNFERETEPPYPFPVRGVSASIRLIEKGTKQVYQSSIVHSFVPE